MLYSIAALFIATAVQSAAADDDHVTGARNFKCKSFEEIARKLDIVIAVDTSCGLGRNEPDSMCNIRQTFAANIMYSFKTTDDAFDIDGGFANDDIRVAYVEFSDETHARVDLNDVGFNGYSLNDEGLLSYFRLISGADCGAEASEFTQLYDTVEESLNQFREEPEREQYLIILSNCVSEQYAQVCSHYGYLSVQSSEVRVFMVNFGAEFDRHSAQHYLTCLVQDPLDIFTAPRYGMSKLDSILNDIEYQICEGPSAAEESDDVDTDDDDDVVPDHQHSSSSHSSSEHETNLNFYFGGHKH
jgi:hypothetical protein